jgi:hypothetical protein
MRPKIPTSSVVTLLTTLFIAGVCWGAASTRLNTQQIEIDRLNEAQMQHEVDVKDLLIGVNNNINDLKVTIAGIANDIEWIKENQ